MYNNNNNNNNTSGWYRCIASNAWGITQHDAYLTVRDLCADLDCGARKTCKADYIRGNKFGLPLICFFLNYLRRGIRQKLKKIKLVSRVVFMFFGAGGGGARPIGPKGTGTLPILLGLGLSFLDWV